MLGGGSYPISVAELRSYSEDADELFEKDEHERLKERLAFWPDSGDLILGTDGVRKLLWTYRTARDQKREVLIVYFFRDLNMPLYLLAVFADGDCDFDDEWRAEMAELVAQLVEEHARQWARVWKRPDSSA